MYFLNDEKKIVQDEVFISRFPPISGKGSCLDYLYAKSLPRQKLIHSRNIDGQRILQSDSMRGTPGHSKPKVVAVDLDFP